MPTSVGQPRRPRTSVASTRASHARCWSWPSLVLSLALASGDPLTHRRPRDDIAANSLTRWATTCRRAGGLRDFYAHLPPRSQESYFDRRIRWLQVRSARTACRPNRICPCRGIARALCVCRELAQVQLLRLRLHQPPARPSSRPQVRTARNMCRSARTHTMRWRCTRSLTACHRVWPVLCAHCAGVQQDALARNDLSLTEGPPRVGIEMTNAHARAPTRAQLLNRVNPSTCERSARKNGSLSSLLAACRTVAIFARPR